MIDKSKVPPFMRRAAAAAAAVMMFVGVLTVGAGAASAAPAAPTAGMSAYCYQWPLEHVAAIYGDGDGGYYTNAIQVTIGSPCHDVNVRGVTADGAGTCRTMRVRWGGVGGAAGAWRRVCTGWQVLASNAAEGRVFVIQIQGRPAMLGVRT